MASAEEVFKALKDFWTVTACEMVKELDPEMDDERMLAVLDRLWEVIQDREVDGHSFAPGTMSIDGNVKTCVQGSVLDPRIEGNLIREYHRKFVLCVRNLRQVVSGKEPDRFIHLCSERCVGCEKASKERCIAEMKSVLDLAVGEGGLLDSIISEVQKNPTAWRVTSHGK